MSSFYSSAIQLPTYSGEIYGTLTFQSREARSVAILLLSDAGATDRNGNSADGFNTSDCMKLVAQGLAGFGISSLRYDKRGTGLSDMPTYYAGEMQLDDFVEDAIYAAHYLKDKLGFSRVVIAGHGEGALIGMLATAKAPIDGFVSLGGSAVNAASLLYDQLHHRLSGDLLDSVKHILAQLRDGCVVDAVPDELNSLFGLDLQPYLISLFRHEPVEIIAGLNIPTLIIHGNRDIQVPYQDARTLAASCPGSQLKLIKGMNHVLKSVDSHTGNQLLQYRDGSLPLSDHLIADISAFVARIVGNARRAEEENFELESENLMALI